MPTEDYSNSLRISRIRQRATLKGLSKVARALDNDTQHDIKLGGVNEKTKRSGVISYACGVCTTNTNAGCSGEFQLYDSQSITVTCDGTECSYIDGVDIITAPQVNVVVGQFFTALVNNAYSFVNCSGQDILVYVDGAPQFTLANNEVFFIPRSKNDTLLEFRAAT